MSEMKGWQQITGNLCHELVNLNHRIQWQEVEGIYRTLSTLQSPGDRSAGVNRWVETGS